MDSQHELIFLKLGGSLISDKQGVEVARPFIIDQLAGEIAEALQRRQNSSLVIGHGSGSFGHVAAHKHGTRQGVSGPDGWRGFAEVSAAAARLNQIVREALFSAGVPVLTIQPSASAICEDGRIRSMDTRTISRALAAGLVPLLYGDVAFDLVRGGTIISTEEILGHLAPFLRPKKILLAGETPGVYDHQNRTIPMINREILGDTRSTLKGSRGTDVTGGMLTKVESMVDLVEDNQGLSVIIFSGLDEGNVLKALTGEELERMTSITPGRP